ncbi:MAG TPA: DUF2637 domain-containing protein [Pseudonocardia sp.]|jgi:hypothetical protein
MRTTVRLSLAVVALAAAMLSFESLMRLGELAGYGGLSSLFPIVVDAGAASSCAAWLHTRGRQPLIMTWCLLAVSVVLNGTVHWLESTGTAPSWPLVVAVAAVPPTVLGLCLHLAVGLGGPVSGPERHGEPSDRAGRGGGRAFDQHETVAREPAEAVDPLAELIQSGASRRKLAAELGVTEYRAGKLLDAHRNGDGR